MGGPRARAGGAFIHKDEGERISSSSNGFLFEYTDEHYARLIPDDPPGTNNAVSVSFIRNYVRRMSQFKGFVELEFEIDTTKAPENEGELLWIPLRTRIQRQGKFHATPHFFRVRFDPTVYQTLGGPTGPGAMLYQSAIESLNSTRFPENSFAWRNQLWFYNSITLGMTESGEGTPQYALRPADGAMLFRFGETVLTFKVAEESE